MPTSEDHLSADPDGYRHIPDAVVTAIGKLVISAGNVDGVTHSISDSLGIPRTQKLDLAPLIEKIKDNVQPDDSLEIANWCERVIAAMEERNSLLHSFFHFEMIDDVWVTYREVVHPGEPAPITLHDLDQARADLEAVLRDGNNIMDALSHQDPKHE